MNIHDPALQGRAMLEAIADAGLAGLGAMERVMGAGGVTRASDLHRLVDAQLVDADALAAFLASRYGVRLLDGDALEELEICESEPYGSLCDPPPVGVPPVVISSPYRL